MPVTQQIDNQNPPSWAIFATKLSKTSNLSASACVVFAVMCEIVKAYGKVSQSVMKLVRYSFSKLRIRTSAL